MPRLCMFIDDLGLTCDDLWSYYEVLGRPAWVPVASMLLFTSGLAALLLT